MKEMKLEKGGLISVGGIWYIVIGIFLKNGVISIDCLCDHANNIHNFYIENIEYAASLKEIYKYSYSNSSKLFNDLVNERPIPYEEIAMVLSGNEDHRFDHWHEEPYENGI